MSALIIAEIGVNHDGSTGKALHLMRAAKKSGADVVKFQAYRSSEITAPGAHRDMLRRYELTRDQFRVIKREADILGVEFMASVFDTESADFMRELGCRSLKVGSGELTNFLLLHHLSTFGMPLIVSTGMADLGECRVASRVLGAASVTWLHCVSAYPAPASACNLRCMQSMRDELRAPVGLSDHTLGDHIATAAVALGATVIEKHITLRTTDTGPDHAASMEPAPFTEMVRKIREVEAAMGDGEKRMAGVEVATLPRARRVKTEEGFRREP